MDHNYAVGIDLGTSNSCVATLVNGKIRVLPNERGERTAASVVHFEEDGTTTIGNTAKARVVLDPRNTVSFGKRLIGRYFFNEEVRKAKVVASYEIEEGPRQSVRIRVRNRHYTLPEISAMVLRETRRIAEQALGQEVKRAVITVPAYFNDSQRQATKDAGRIAGLEVLRIINEPTAAALAYGYGRELTQKVAVYDLGGGTFDVSILEIGKDVYEVLSTCGDTFLGGEDFDDRIIDVVADAFHEEHGVNIRRDRVAREKVRAAAERAKIQLSEDDVATMHVPDIATVNGLPVGLSYTLDREEFEKLVGDLLQRTYKVCDEALQQAGLTVRDLDAVILVGGPTRLPTIREGVRKYFQREPETGINPDEVVAIGAGIHAHTLAAGATDTFLLDVTPLSLRLGIVGGMTEAIIERNTPVPIEQTRMFTTVRDNQEEVALRIYQGESRSAKGNELLGEFEFSGFERAPRGQAQIEVTFAISIEGIVKVSARDANTGAERSTTVKLSGGLLEEEIEAILKVNRESADSGARAPAPQASRLGPGVSALPDSSDHSLLLEGELPTSGKLELPEADDEELVLEIQTEKSESTATSSESELFGRIEHVLNDDEDDELGS